jgi:hypothetical protein
MNIRHSKSALTLAAIVVFLAGAIFIPRGIFGAVCVVLGTVFALGAIHYLLPVFSQSRAAIRWGGSSSPRMSRLSMLFISALHGCSAVWLFLWGLAVRRADTHYFFVAIISLLVLVFIGRWLDTGRWSS